MKRNLSKQRGIRSFFFVIAVGICFLCAGHTAMADDYAYYTAPGVFGTVDLTTGTTVVGSTFLTGLAPSPGIGVVNGTLYTLDYSYPSGQLHSIDTVAQTTSALNAFTVGMNGFPIGSANNVLYTIGRVALSNLQVQYYLTSIATTGLTSNIGSPFVKIYNTITNSSGLANDSNKLYFILSGTLYALDTSGNVVGSGLMAPGLSINSLIFENGTLYGAGTDHKIYMINTTTGAATFLSNAVDADGNALSIIGLAPAPEQTPSAVPEPATMLLLGFGLIGLAGYGRRELS